MIFINALKVAPPVFSKKRRKNGMIQIRTFYEFKYNSIILFPNDCGLFDSIIKDCIFENIETLVNGLNVRIGFLRQCPLYDIFSGMIVDNARLDLEAGKSIAAIFDVDGLQLFLLLRL